MRRWTGLARSSFPCRRRAPIQTFLQTTRCKMLPPQSFFGALHEDCKRYHNPMRRAVPITSYVSYLADISKSSTAMAPSTLAKNGVSATRFTTLPLEIQINILHHCLPPSLKQLRQSCVFLGDLTSPILFDTIHIFPHMQHLANVLELCTCPPVRVLVRRVVYDLRFATLARRIIRRIETVFSTNANVHQRDLALIRARNFEKQNLDAGCESIPSTVST